MDQQLHAAEHILTDDEIMGRYRQLSNEEKALFRAFLDDLREKRESPRHLSSPAC